MKHLKKIYSFPRGGLVFEDPHAPESSSIETAFLPVVSVVPLLQHTGIKASPTVYVGEYVKEGMIVGRAQGAGSAHIHATVPGKVVRMASWKTVDGEANEALVIRMEGSFEKLGKKETLYPWNETSVIELQRLIADFGVVEMDERGRPFAELLAVSGGANYGGARIGGKTLVSITVRCVFDDPWLAADKALCNERLKAVVEGSFITAKACGAASVVFAVSHKEKQLLSQIQHALTTMQSMYPDRLESFAVPVGSRYPQHNERELELVLREYEKREAVSLGKLFIVSPSTLSAVYDAVVLRKPILDRYVAVGGAAVKSPKVLKARIGTRLRDMFEQCGGFVSEPTRVAIGSPLCGRMVLDLDEPITKTSYAAVALLNREVGGTVPRSCIACGECREVCPVGLDPEELYKRIIGGANNLSASDCHGCGCCESVCPSRLPLSAAICGAGLAPIGEGTA